MMLDAVDGKRKFDYLSLTFYFPLFFFFFFQRKAQITCTAIFIVWGVLVHLVIPPFVFMVTEGWDYIEGLYFSFITITTIGFGDFVAGQ